MASLSTSTLILSLAGGVLIGVAASLLLALTGRTAGISGIVAGLFSRDVAEVRWRAFFVGGLVVGGALLLVVRPAAIAADVQRSVPVTALAGLLVGVGTSLAGGCTSGHGICGVSRLSKRSIAATATFVATGVLSAVVMGHMLGAGR
jgi:uncharacterized membrane protein YedE/YeeE